MACRPVSAWSGKYYSLKYYGDAALNRTNSGVAFAEFSLFGTDGKRVNQGTYAYTPLTVTEMASPANLKSWTVRVNGVERADLGVRWSNGVLRVSGGGLQVIFRWAELGRMVGRFR